MAATNRDRLILILHATPQMSVAGTGDRSRPAPAHGQRRAGRRRGPAAGAGGGLRPNGIKIGLKRIGEKAGLKGVYAHRWRHSFAHEWKLAGGDTGDLMVLLGWSSEEMPRRYGASAAAERAQQTQTRLGIGERV